VVSVVEALETPKPPFPSTLRQAQRPQAQGTAPYTPIIKTARHPEPKARDLLAIDRSLYYIGTDCKSAPAGEDVERELQLLGN